MIVAPVMADQFPDVPENHWAYKELEQLKTDGLLVGYPDGLFRGGRPASRYEMAVAIFATYNALKTQNAALKTQLDDLARRMDGLATKDEVAALTSRIAALEAEVNRIKSEDIDRLNKLTSFLSDELKKLGADVDAMKKDIDDLKGRVTTLENARFPFDVSGDLNLVMLGGYGTDGHFGISNDGRPLGVGRDSYAGGIVGATRDLTVLHEGAIRVVSNDKFDPSGKVHFVATAVYGNMFDGFGRTTGTAFGDQSTVRSGAPFMEGDGSLYFQDFAVSFDTSLAGLAFNANLGRVGMKVGPYIFQKLDNTPYFANDRWDDGMYRFDGGILGFNFGKAKLDVFGGRESNVITNQGDQINPIIAGQTGIPFSPGLSARPMGVNFGQFNVDQLMGAKLSIPLTSTGALNLAYLWLDSNTITGGGPTPQANGVHVFGGDVAFNFGGLAITGNYSQSDVVFNNHNRVDDNNKAWAVNAAYNRDRFGIKGGYRNIDPQFAAPGDWGRIGIWYNPTDIRGFMADAHYDLSDSLRLHASGEFYTGTGTTINGVDGLDTDDKINTWKVGLEYKLATNYSLALGYEEVRWDLKDRPGVGFTGGEPTERWYNIGFGFDINSKAKLSFLWQISDYDSKSVAGFNPFGGSDNRAKGGLITTQLTIKY